MKQLIRRYGIGPSLDHEGKPIWALFEVDDIGNCKGPPYCYNPDRELLIRAIEHLHGIFDDHIEWVGLDQPGPAVQRMIQAKFQ